MALVWKCKGFRLYPEGHNGQLPPVTSSMQPQHTHITAETFQSVQLVRLHSTNTVGECKQYCILAMDPRPTPTAFSVPKI